MYSLVLIEDEPLTLNLLASLIQWEKYGFMLLEKFEDSKAALEFIKARKPDLVISDIKMPKVSGLEIAKYCFENLKETQVALISAYRDFEYAKQAIKYAVKDYIEKPVNMKEMINLLENYKKEHPKSMHIPDDEEITDIQLLFADLLYGMIANTQELKERFKNVGLSENICDNPCAVFTIHINKYDYINNIVLNGNQTGSLLCEYILRKERDLKNGIIVKTIVTTEMVKAISKDFGVKVVDVLTGFKYIGDKIKKCEEENTKFLFGLEESYGYLKGTYARDKDAVVASMLVCEMAAEYKQKGLTLYDALQKLYKKHGYYLERLKTATLKGACGAEKIKTIMRNLRNSVPKEIAGQKVLEIKDYAKGIDNLPKSDVLKFILESGWIAARPSGTEPKIKFYFGVCEKNEYSANTALEQFTEYIDGFLS